MLFKNIRTLLTPVLPFEYSMSMTVVDKLIESNKTVAWLWIATLAITSPLMLLIPVGLVAKEIWENKSN